MTNIMNILQRVKRTFKKMLGLICLCGVSSLLFVSCYESDEEIIEPVYAVDLGLSVKWAWCNLGANNPKEYGGYYAWGETTAKSNWYGEENNYKYYDPSSWTYKDLGSNISGTSYDAALGAMGDDWRMPTKEEIQELIDLCTWEWVSLYRNDYRYYKEDGYANDYQSGFLVTSPNGNKIFLPGGSYWSGTNESFNAYNNKSYCLSFENGSDYSIRSEACYAVKFIRPVKGELKVTDDEKENPTSVSAVDLGLSVKWASCNIGATSPEQYGDYFAWGETQIKSTYNSSNSVTNGLSGQELFANNIIGDDGNLTPTYDAAKTLWDENWRMPTESEVQELYNECHFEWTTMNGVYGRKVTGPNGNSIFLPASGFRYGTSLNGVGTCGDFWSATPYENGACRFYYDSEDYYMSNSARYYGRTIRPVYAVPSRQITITTGEANDITAYSATLTGVVSGTYDPITCGIIYGTSSDMSSPYNNREETTSCENYTVSVTDLHPGTTYYYCAYAIVNGEEKHGEVLSFTTEQGEGNAYEAVDLGLSVMWATYNVGATSPEGYGDYFAWGETQPKYGYYTSNSITYGLSDAELESRGIIDAYGNLTPTYDAATANWGSDWRMPTYDEFEELIDNSTVEWTYVNGMCGYNVKSNINGNSIFLPANGYYDQDLLDGSGAYGFYWAATNYSDSEDDVKGACCLFFYSSNCGYDYYNERNCGQAVRPVTSGISKPEVTIATGEATDVTAYGATLCGTVSGTDETITCGVIYGTSSDLSLNDYREETSANGTYSVSISNLQPGTTYYYCAYVVVDDEYKYGETYSFTTEQSSGTGEYEAVDLGLSVKWATFNVGATSPEEYGSYFAWGETQTKDSYTESNSVTYDLSVSELVSLGIIDAIGDLTAGYDVATTNWGGSWRMPTLTETQELINNCTWEWTIKNGVYGSRVTGPNGNFIFLPAAGYRIGTSLSYAGSNGNYSSSSSPHSDDEAASGFYFDSGHCAWDDNYFRYVGRTVRPVYSEASQPVVTIETGEATDITTDGATLSGTVSGTDETITCGVIYGTSSDLSLNDYREETSANGTYSVSISNLQPGTTYYYRAYVVVDGEYKYGETYSFTTEQASGTGEYEAVDLGLSVKWATFNVGATSPEGFGDYFAWGETGAKSYYGYNNSTTYGYSHAELRSLGILDASGNLAPTYDAATANWGSEWRMPTKDEQDELRENCDWVWTTVNGVDGYRVTSRTNGNSIFLPVTGFLRNTSSYSSDYGYYWSATPYSGSYISYYFYFYSSYCNLGSDNRSDGRAVRPVYSEASQPVVTIETGEATDITTDGATLSGTVSGTDEYVTCGFIYGTSSDLSFNDNYIELYTNGSYSYGVSYLQPSTTYYYRAYVYVDGEYKYGETYSFTTEQESGTGEYEAVDLGLSVKWASFNVGATSPEQYGDYFAWGETQTKDDYSTNNSVTYGMYYSELKSHDIIDADGNLAATYDAATANWGISWRMPTLAEINELIYNCTWSWTTQNGIYGYMVTGPNGNSIFLPAAGRREGTSLNNAGSRGYYLSSTPSSSNSSYADSHAYDLYFYSGTYDYRNSARDDGQVVRPVYSEASQPVVTIGTGEATDITTDGATLSGTVSGTDEYVTCGIIYGTSSELSFNDNYIEVYANGTYSVSISNLQPGTTYYYRAYVYVDGEYKYGETYLFTTEQESGTGEYEAVDLGLSVKWATCNVGATSPEEYGDYFAWGETVTKESYTESNSITDGLYTSGLESRGIIDANGNLTATYDAATVNWGGSWRMPTLTEIQELIDNCTWEWTTQNGVYGRLVTGPNGNSIFFPAAGCRYDTSLRSEGTCGSYWSASPYNSIDGAYSLYLLSGKYYCPHSDRSYGRSVRPVSE